MSVFVSFDIVNGPYEGRVLVNTDLIVSVFKGNRELGEEGDLVVLLNGNEFLAPFGTFDLIFLATHKPIRVENVDP